MTITIENGLRNAKQKALRNASAAVKAQRTYGRILDSTRGGAPKGLGIGHLLRVNPSLEVSPAPTTYRRRGFLYVTADAAAKAELDWATLDDPTTCGFVWGNDINMRAIDFYNTNSDVFSSADEDYWKCVYAQQSLGDSAFDLLWRRRDRSEDLAYNSIIYAVNAAPKALPGWTVIQLKRMLFQDIPYVFEAAASSGTLTTEKFGMPPVLNKTDMQQVYNR